MSVLSEMTLESALSDCGWEQSAHAEWRPSPAVRPVRTRCNTTTPVSTAPSPTS
jgi:hypothetical protein